MPDGLTQLLQESRPEQFRLVGENGRSIARFRVALPKERRGMAVSEIANASELIETRVF